MIILCGRARQFVHTTHTHKHKHTQMSEWRIAPARATDARQFHRSEIKQARLLARCVWCRESVRYVRARASVSLSLSLSLRYVCVCARASEHARVYRVYACICLCVLAQCNVAVFFFCLANNSTFLRRFLFIQSILDVGSDGGNRARPLQ